MGGRGSNDLWPRVRHVHVGSVFRRTAQFREGRTKGVRPIASPSAGLQPAQLWCGHPSPQLEGCVPSMCLRHAEIANTWFE